MHIVIPSLQHTRRTKPAIGNKLKWLRRAGWNKCKEGEIVTYKVAICDDNRIDADYVTGMLKDWAAARGHLVHPAHFESAEEFLFHYAEEKDVDILLLDIEMGGMDGVAMAKKVRQDNDAVQIVFITGYPDYIGEGYEVSALHYLMKPVGKEKLFTVLDRAISNLQKKRKAVMLPVDGELRRVQVEDIKYVEAFSHSVSVVTVAGIYELRKALSEMEALLGEDFVRCHRSYLVNLQFVSGLSKTRVSLDDGMEIPLSRSAAASVHRAFVSYYKGEEHETV